jgi:glutamate/tyrosine decarboxylase-like PLP-dependent enzyme
MNMLERLKQLEATSRQLESDTGQRLAGLEAVTTYVENFLQAEESRPVYAPDQTGVAAAATAMALHEEPAGMDDILTTLGDHVDSSGLFPVSSRFFAYIPGGGLFPSALADYIAAATDRYAGVQHSTPGATRMERLLIRWLADEIGYPESAEGDLTSGGSIATLSALIAAREAFDIRSRDVEQMVIYSTELTHHCFGKALRIAGLKECPVRTVPLDDRFRMDADRLERQIAADKKAGLRPWIIAATAGSTDTGSVDPLCRLADIARVQNLWFHVDAAYGGAFQLCQEGARRLEGLERSDSLILDPHKGLFIPYGTGLVLVRDGAHLYDAYHARGAYMQDLSGESSRLDQSPCDFSPELSRHYRCLRLWMPLKLKGIAPFRAALEEKLLLAAYFHDQIAGTAGFETGPYPDLSVVIFRYVPERGDPDQFNRRLADAVRDDGRIYFSTTTLNGRLTLRLAVLGYHTHVDDIHVALEVIREKARALAAA